MTITLKKIQKAKSLLANYLPPTPLLKNSWLSEKYECNIFLKLENMATIGSFKLRGATVKLNSLTTNQKSKGIIAASAGNHAQGVAWASNLLGIDALIVMQEGVPLIKIHNTESLGAKVVLYGETYDEAFTHSKKIASQTKRIIVHAYNDEQIISGQGTVGLEILDQLPEVNIIIGPMGGGGLMAGVSIAVKEQKPDTAIIGCQALGASPLVQAIQNNRPVKLAQVNTFADGIAISEASESIRKILQSRLSRVLTEDDEAIAAAVLALMEESKIVAEGAGALPLAVLEQIREEIKGKNVVLIISGGNIDVNLLSRIIDRGLIRAGRRIRVNVVLLDRPGSFATLTRAIASKGANILQAIHDRNEPGTSIEEAEVALTLETRGPEHSRAVLETIKQNSVKLVF